MKKISRWLILLLLLGLIFRIIIASWSLQYRENTDVLRYKDAVRISYLHGFVQAYKSNFLTFGTLPNNQPPGSLYILSAAYNLELQTAKIIFRLTNTSPINNQFVNGPLVTIFLRIPSILADLALGLMIYLFIRRAKTEKSALLGASLFLFSPPVWYNSAFWGQMDALNNLIFFVSLFFLINKKYFLAILFAFLSIFIKFSLLPLLPFFLFLLFASKKLQVKKLILFTFIALIVIFVLTIPVSGVNIFWLVDYIKNNSLGEMQFITNFAFNFWWTIFHPSISIGNPSTSFSFSEIRLINSPLDSVNYLYISLHTWAIGLFVIFSIPLVKKIYALREKILYPQNLLILFSVLSILIFLLLPRMHERYMYPLFPLMAALVGLSGKYLKTFILFSILNFINLYIVWHPMTLSILPYNLINNSTFQWILSICTVAVIFIFYFSVIRHGFIHEKRK